MFDYLRKYKNKSIFGDIKSFMKEFEGDWRSYSTSYRTKTSKLKHFFWFLKNRKRTAKNERKLLEFAKKMADPKERAKIKENESRMSLENLNKLEKNIKKTFTKNKIALTEKKLEKTLSINPSKIKMENKLGTVKMRKDFREEPVDISKPERLRDLFYDKKTKEVKE
jgi:hypothetical protein